MKTAILTKLILIAFFTLPVTLVMGQIISLGALAGASLNRIHTSVPFLTIAPDSRSAGIGDAGVATEADVNSQHWNAAKYAFIDGNGGLSFTYTPWLTNLIPDINLYYLSGYYRINSKSTLSASFRYFSLGSIVFGWGMPPSSFNPREFALDAGYARKFTDHLSGAVVFRYIQSDLLDASSSPNGQTPISGISVAADLGLYYLKEVDVGENNATWTLGMNISNIGTSVSYSEDAEGLPIPTNLRMGVGFKYEINSDHSVSLNVDMNKLLVPTPPVYDHDTITGDLRIVRGKAPPQTLVGGMFQSFGDAPGVQRSDRTYSVFQEEMNEIAFSFGAEYRFKNLLAIRTGHFREHSAKGNRKYWTIGIGGKYGFYSLDLAYLLPANGQNSPLANTIKLTLGVEFGMEP